MAFSFFGGVHPKENKWYACDKETQVFPEPDIVVIPMAQHIGAPCEPCVAVGDKVKIGQKIGDSEAFMSAPVHASISGVVKEIKEVRRGRIKEYVEAVPSAKYFEGKGIWTVKCDIALPCATQNEINEDDAKALIANGVQAVGEGANMPSTPEAVAAFQGAGVLFAPAKAANAGGVAVSALEMSQNSMRYTWTAEEVDKKLYDIMKNIHDESARAAEENGLGYDLVAGANIAGFEKVANAMMFQGII